MAFLEYFFSIVRILAKDVNDVVCFYFLMGSMPLGLNSNFLLALAKVSDAASLDNFGPIVHSNILFKIITKIIADRFASIASRIVSLNHFGFSKSRNISDYIAAASI